VYTELFCELINPHLSLALPFLSPGRLSQADQGSDFICHFRVDRDPEGTPEFLLFYGLRQARLIPTQVRASSGQLAGGIGCDGAGGRPDDSQQFRLAPDLPTGDAGSLRDMLHRN
jgi:hypothetical protein